MGRPETDEARFFPALVSPRRGCVRRMREGVFIVGLGRRTLYDAGCTVSHRTVEVSGGKWRLDGVDRPNSLIANEERRKKK